MAMMFQAIVTKYIGPTNMRGSRIKAQASAGSLTLEWDNGLNPDDNHLAAAKALATKMGWQGHWFIGGLPKGNGCAFVCKPLGAPACDFTITLAEPSAKEIARQDRLDDVEEERGDYR